MTEEKFIKEFILELILVEKESVFDLDEVESVSLPKNYLSIINNISKKDARSSNLLFSLDQNKIAKEFINFQSNNDVFIKENDDSYDIVLGYDSISSILSDKTLSSNDKFNITCLAEKFLLESNKSKSKVLTYK